MSGIWYGRKSGGQRSELVREADPRLLSVKRERVVESRASILATTSHHWDHSNHPAEVRGVWFALEDVGMNDGAFGVKGIEEK